MTHRHSFMSSGFMGFMACASSNHIITPRSTPPIEVTLRKMPLSSSPSSPLSSWSAAQTGIPMHSHASLNYASEVMGGGASLILPRFRHRSGQLATAVVTNEGKSASSMF